ncbi:MAG TPA: aspartate aminotransferase family protein [Solirubrobacteraceae bacterium]|nr:aspartate aminotransferase family protein [Solirubrobacteraceae bacterium]
MPRSSEMKEAASGSRGPRLGGDDQAEWLRRDRESVGQSPYPAPLVIERRSGCELWDLAGTRYLDFESGQFCMSTGHSHPAVAAALREQSGELMQIGNRFTNRPRIRLAERLADISGLPQPRTFFCSTGSEANETALRIAKLTTGRFEVISVARGYHGRSSAVFGLSSSARHMRRGYGPSVPGMGYVAPPYSYRCPFGCGAECDAGCWRYSVGMLERSTAGEPAAVIIEFVLGGGGVIPGSRAWAQAIRNWCDEQGALLIADEALTGIGRTGSWFAFEHFGVQPDIVVTSKALGGGVPAAAVIASRRVADAAIERGFIQAASHQGDPYQCAAALANIAVIESEDLLRNTIRQGQLLSSHLNRLVQRFAIAGDARGIGLIQGLEIVHSDGSEAPEVAAEVCVACMNEGLIVGGLRPGIREGNVLRLAPPLVVTSEQIVEAVEILEQALKVVSDRRQSLHPA